MHDIEPEVPLGPFDRLVEVTSQPVVRAQFYAAALATFAAVATLLAALGVYGSVSSLVVQRRRRIGICLALGATTGRVIRDVATHGIIPTSVGVIAGVPLALAAGQIVRAQLFGVEPTDVLTIAAVGVMMLAVATAASVAPALRAARVDPAAALRHESLG